MITIGFIRHGTTEWNLLGRMQGRTDIPLAAAGREQAAMLGKRLAAEKWDGIVSSHLSRAAETAEIIARISGIPLWGSDPRLQERGFGRLEGTTLCERIAALGEQWREMDHGKESLKELLARWDHFLAEAPWTAEGGRVLIVSHGGFIEPVLAHRCHVALEKHLDNASLSVLSFDSSDWSCSLLNCTKHLENAERITDSEISESASRP
jgi:probable phosphoglycerate mutase